MLAMQQLTRHGRARLNMLALMFGGYGRAAWMTFEHGLAPIRLLQALPVVIPVRNNPGCMFDYRHPALNIKPFRGAGT
jgi:hypothetical protein